MPQLPGEERLVTVYADVSQRHSPHLTDTWLHHASLRAPVF